MKNKPKVSVIMPLYNVEKDLEKSVYSIINQTYQNIEIIMCDDCSTDDSLKLAQKLAKKDERIIVLKNDKNLRAGATRNKCIEYASGKYIAIQDADDYSETTRIEKQVEVLEKHPEFAFVSSSVYRFDEQGIWGEYNPWSKEPQAKDFLWGLPYVHPATMFKKDVLDEIKGYRVAKDTARTEDFDLFLRLHIAGYKGYNIQEKLCYYNENIDAYMRRKYRYRIDEARTRIKAYKKLNLMPQGYLFVLKPLLVGLIPRKLQYKLRKSVVKKTSNSESVRVLQVISKPHLGGVETMLMNVYRNINRDIIQFDFTNMSNEAGEYEKEITKLGGKIHYINPIRKIGVLKYINQIRKLVRKNNYKIVHSHISINNSFVLLGALLGGAKIRISHAHTTTTEKPNSLKYKIITNAMKLLNKIVANTYCACGNLAAQFLYGNKTLKSGKVKIIKNAIDVEKFKKYYGEKDKIRNKFKLSKTKKIIGHIGRFDGTVKNHKFIIDIASEMKKTNKINDYIFLLIGDGKDINKYKKMVENKNLSKNFVFFGTTKNIPEIMSTLDYLILPSLYEGLPVVAIESQASGINTIVSDKVTKEIDLGLNLVNFICIERNDIKDWINQFQKENEEKLNYNTIEQKLDENGYSIHSSVKAFYSLYEVESR